MKRDVILYVGAFELPDRNAAAHRVRSNAMLLASLGYKVVLIGRNSTPGIPANKLQKVDYPEIEHECWEMGHPANRREWLRYTTSSASLKKLIIEQFEGRLHSVICYNFPAIAQLRIRNLAQRMGGMALADVTEWYQKYYVTGVAPIIKNLDTALRMRVLNFAMDGLITTSRFLTRFYSRRFDNLVELPTLIAIDEEPEAYASLDGTPKRIIFAGAIENKRAASKVVGGLKDQLDWVIELLGEADLQGANFHFDIFGVERDAYLNFFENHAELVARLSHKIVFHGRKPRSLLQEKLKKADFSIFMRPDIRTTNAGFPTKFSESITFGVPVITNKLDCLEPYMKDGKNCIIIARDDMSGSVARILQALSMTQSEVLGMSNYCLDSKQFHPLSYREEAQKLFPEVKGES